MKTLMALCVAALCIGCAAKHWPTQNEPGVRLEGILDEWREMRDAGLQCEDSGRHDNPQVDCGRLRDALERVAVEFPRDAQILFVSAVLAYETGAREQAQFYLDTTLDRSPDHARAAELRSRIALEEGNLAFAERLLDRTIELRPDAAGLREARAAVAYAMRDWAAARRALTTAGRLGAPAWRLDYHEGLISEAEGDLERAEAFYREALAARPDWQAPRSRIRGLWAERAR
ncbi:MAG: tetratricopeptide repeat protein [Proteobacteria bacterium]|nr:tetratricopeptide repeat protein [Pseudomonadota bacterium]